MATRYRSPRKNYLSWGKPEFVKGRWQIRRTFRRAGNYRTIGFDEFILVKKR